MYKSVLVSGFIYLFILSLFVEHPSPGPLFAGSMVLMAMAFAQK